MHRHARRGLFRKRRDFFDRDQIIRTGRTDDNQDVIWPLVASAVCSHNLQSVLRTGGLKHCGTERAVEVLDLYLIAFLAETVLALPTELLSFFRSLQPSVLTPSLPPAPLT